MIDYEKLCKDLAQMAGLTLWHDKNHTLVYGDGMMETFPIEFYNDEEIKFLRSIAAKEYPLEHYSNKRNKRKCVCGWCSAPTDNCFGG